MKLLPCVLSALIMQQADAKRKKRGKQYLTVGHNSAAETEIPDDEERLVTDCSLFFRDSQSTNADNTAGRITMTGDYASLIGADSCGWAVDAPKNCDIRFRVNKIHTEQFVNPSCDLNDFFYIKWPGGRGRDKGVANSGRICSPETFEDAGQARCERDTPNPNCDMVHSFGQVGDWKSTNKDNIFVKFSSDGDGSDSMHSTAFDLEWECEGSPDLSGNLATCEVTDSVFGTVGWKLKDKKRYFAKSGPGQEVFPASNDLFPSYDAENETRDGCGAMCANTAGCYFWNWKKSTEQCSLTLGTKPGFKGIKQQTNQNYIGQSLSGSCGGDIKFGTSYQKSSRFYCKFQTPAQNAAFVEDLAADNEEITICPYDGIMTTTKILGITAETPRDEDDTQARYRWTKFTLATHIRVDPNKPALKEFCQAAPSVWDGNVAYFVKQKAENLKCGKHLSNISWNTHSVSDLKKVENTDSSLFLSDTAQNCPSNCANTPGCSGFQWDGESCRLGFGYISSYGAGENENIEFTGRMTSGQFSHPFT